MPPALPDEEVPPLDHEHNMIDQKHFQELKYRIETLRLGMFDPSLLVHFARIRPETNSPADQVLWAYLVARVDALAKDYDMTGTITVPAPFLPTGFPVGYQQGTESIASISDRANAIIAGTSGSGKTTLLQHALLSAYQQGYKLFIADPKEDSRFWTAIEPRFITIDATSSFNILQRPPWRTIDEHITETVELFRRSFYSGETQGAVVRKALQIIFGQSEQPSLEQLHKTVDAMLRKGDTFTWRDATTGIGERLNNIKTRYPGMYQATGGHSVGWLLQHHLYLPLLTLDPVGEWVCSLLLNHVFQRNKYYGVRDITTVAAVDEGIGLVGRAHAASNITGTNSLGMISTMNREYGLRLLFTTIDLGMTDPLVLSSASTIAILPGANDKSLYLAGLTKNQYEGARQLQPGQAIIRYPGQLSYPVITTFNPLPDGLKEQRPITPVQPAVPATPLLQTQTAPLAETGKPNDTASAALGISKHEQLIINHLATNVVDLVSATYDAIGMHYATGDFSKTSLLQKGLITGTPITVGKGRGKRAIALMLTAEGRTLATTKHGKASRGCGPQSQWLIQELHRLLHASIDTPCGSKAPDLFLRINKEQHGLLLLAINEAAHTFENEPQLSEGDVLAIEVECSDPAKTIQNNLTKNRLAGLKNILFAVMPKDITASTKLVSTISNDTNGLFVIDALTLLSLLNSGVKVEDYSNGTQA